MALLTAVEKRSIIDFMDIKPIFMYGKYSWNDGVFFCTSNTEEIDTINSIVEYVKYETSWDWIMPVVDKIESIEGDDFEVLFYDFTSCQVYDRRKGENICDEGCETKIESVCRAALKFIEFYNKNFK